MTFAFRPSRRALALSLALLPLARAAEAHALVMASQPESGARMGTPPGQVALRFNSRIDHGRSRLTLFGPDSAPLPLALVPERESALVEATVPHPLAPGAWRLRWQVLAVDGHITRGDIFFTVVER